MGQAALHCHRAAATSVLGCCAGVPRLFVGQIPTTCTEEDLLPVFAGYGEIEKVSLVRGPDNKSRGCCMVRAPWPPAWAACRHAASTRAQDACHVAQIQVETLTACAA